VEPPWIVGWSAVPQSSRHFCCSRCAAETVGFHRIEGYSIFDAFYMTLITITTVGY
jgi:Ion channel